MSKFKNKAHYRCQECGTDWWDDPKPVECPKCDYLYIDWLNYKELFVDKSKQGG
tara:strand:+ start:328 stop:489 length:162 start_codon:yes stop_codon:yes gene_type:complete